MESISVLFKIVQFKAKKNQGVILSVVSSFKKKCSVPNLKKKFYSYVYSIHAFPIRIIQGFVVVC